MNHAYCTYFDHNYLPRALLMLRSLRAYDAESTVYMLALSDLCYQALKRLDLPKVEVIALAELERAYPELLGVKLDRTPIEYVFTLTPVLPLHVLKTTPVERVTYVDADLCFFSPPQPVLDATAQASVAITPHNFSPNLADRIVYGRFNVGWMSFRRSPEGLACLETYKANCLAWCHDRLEGERFADQKYLDAWPEAYPGLTIITHKGVNAAAWNIDNYRVTERDGQFFVDDDPLVCYHFHGVRVEPDGGFEALVPFGQRTAEGLAVEGVLVRRLMRPYIARLLRERAELHRRFPALASADYVSLRYPSSPRQAPGPPWRFMGRAWPARDSDARSSDAAVGAAIAGYLRAEAAKAPNTGQLLGQIVARAAQGRSQLSVLDWRGGLGQNQFTVRAAAPGIEFEWNVVDAPAYCDYGAVLDPQARFHEDLAALDGRRFDLVFACGTLGFDADWRATFAALARAAGQTFMLAPVLVNAGASFVAANHPPEWRNGAGINTWILGEIDLRAAAASAGLKIAEEVPGPPLAMPDAPPGPATARIAVFSRSA